MPSSPSAASWDSLTSPDGAGQADFQTDLVGRTVIVVRPECGVGGPQRADVGHRATIHSVGHDGFSTPIYTLELDTGELVETYGANFRLTPPDTEKHDA